MNDIEVESVTAEAHAEPLQFLERVLREGEVLPEEFVAELCALIGQGEIDALVARLGGEAVGVALIQYRLNISAGGRFASIEELQVRPEDQGRGIGQALLNAVAKSCAARGISYVEVQTDDEAAAFYESCGFEVESEVRVLSRSGTFGEGRAESDARGDARGF